MRRMTRFAIFLAVVWWTEGCGLLVPELRNVERDAYDDHVEVDGDDLEAPGEVEWERDQDVRGDEEVEDVPVDEVVEDVLVDEVAEDVLVEPDAEVAPRVVLFSDGGGGSARNGQYIVRGGITAISCHTARGGGYVVTSCATAVMGP